jgi:hypothetical protein
MAGCADRVQDLLAQVAASATDSSRTAAHVVEHARLMTAIALVADKLSAAQSAVTSWEEQAVQRFLAKAADVPRDGSSLCAPIVDCWLLAAKLMKHAVDGSAAAGTQADTQLVAHYKACAKNCENIVRGPFSDAVNYLAKSEHSTSSFAGSLWQEAAQLLLQRGVHMMQRADRAGTAENFRRVLVGGQTAMEEVQIRCAAACADCVATMETFTDAEVATLTGSLLLRDKESAAHVSPAQTVLQMRYLLVHVERLQLALLISPIVDITWAGMTPSCVVGKLRTVVRDILLLSQTLQVIAPSYPINHLLHQPAPSVEVVYRRNELLHRLAHMTVECYACFRDVVEARQGAVISADCYKLASEDLYTALQLADGIWWHAIPTAGPCHPAYQAHLYSTAELFQVLCKRYLAATRLLLAGQPLSHDLLVKAAQLHLDVENTMPFVFDDTAATSNALVRRAWEVSSKTAKDPLPSNLLLPLDRCDATRAARLQQKALAVVEILVHQTTLDEDDGLSQQEVALRKSAVAFNTHLAEGTTRLMLGGTQLTDAQALEVEDSCARASRAAKWCSLALEALLEEKVDVAALYGHATRFTVTGSNAFILPPDNVSMAGEAQSVGDKAGARFTKAAAALEAGDHPSHERWLQAAEATAMLVIESTHGLRTSCDYCTAALEAADQLAALAAAALPTGGSVTRGLSQRAARPGVVGPLQSVEAPLVEGDATQQASAGYGKRERTAETEADAGDVPLKTGRKDK